MCTQGHAGPRIFRGQAKNPRTPPDGKGRGVLLSPPVTSPPGAPFFFRGANRAFYGRDSIFYGRDGVFLAICELSAYFKLLRYAGAA